MDKKHQTFRGLRTSFPPRDIRKNPRSMYARVPQAMAQFVLKIEKWSHIMETAPIVELARAYGLHPRAWLLEIVRIMNIRPRSVGSRANMKFWGQSLSQGHYQPTYQQARKGLIYFITLPLFLISYLNRSQKASVDLKTNRRDCWEWVNLIALTSVYFHCDRIKPKLDRLWGKINFCTCYLAFFSASFLVRIILKMCQR